MSSLTSIVINEVRNDTSQRQRRLGRAEEHQLRVIQQLKDWELSIVTEAGKDEDLVDLPEYELESRRNPAPPQSRPLANNHRRRDEYLPMLMNNSAKAQRLTSSIHNLNLPSTGKFMILLRNKADKNGKDENIQDYAGNGFFEDFSTNVSTQFWPRIGQYEPAASSIAAFGDNTFASTRYQAWQRKRFQENDGHHKDAWEAVGPKGGLGYDPHADLSTSPGTPGYERTALKSGTDELIDGEVSISEIMYDRGPNGNAPHSGSNSTTLRSPKPSVSTDGNFKFVTFTTVKAGILTAPSP